MIENGMVVDPCGKLPLCYTGKYLGYSGDYDDFDYGEDYEIPEEFVDVFFGIDTSKLTADEETSLWNELDELAYKTNNPDINLGELEVTLIEKGTFEDEDLYGYIEVTGYARESVYEELESLIDKYNVGYVNIKDWR
ncbi:MAG: hypothetical protein IJS29_02355 [Selenomonadaceae bacterium]|nr:hypothetical protein [Selenomonadaceae bacterium]